MATLGVILVLTSTPAGAEVALDDGGKAKLFGDFRVRLEADWDSQRSDGSERDDRNRARIRARLGFTFQPSDNLSFGVRLRSGSDNNHQSPNITVLDFDDNDTGDADFNLDKWYLKAKRGRFSGWVGRDSYPFWKHNDFFWDDDVTPAGLAGTFSDTLGERGKVVVNLAYLSLPVGMQQFSGNLDGAQVVYSRSGDGLSFTLAGGFFGFDANPNDPDGATLLNGNGARDYQIWVGNAQFKLEADRPLTLGADLMHNAEDYSADDPDPFTAANSDQRDGFVASVKWGQARARGDWLLGYYYARIETFAVHSSYAGDDWVRWGAATEGRLSNMKGHELRFVYTVRDTLNIVARLYLAEAITTVEDGKRLRIDFNYTF